MSEKARALGIPSQDLLDALTLIRDLRHAAMKRNLDPRATRIALIFANLVDDYFAFKKLSREQLLDLEEIAATLYEEARPDR